VEELSAVPEGAPPDLSVRLGRLTLANPVMPASGCFGPELAPLLDTAGLGAVVTKTVFSARRAGNPADRLTDTEYGMLNSVGIPSPGTAAFRDTLLPAYRELGAPLVVSIGGLAVEEYWTVADELRDSGAAAFEINVSCPNLEHGGLTIGTSPEMIAKVVAGVRDRVDVPLWVKLTPMLHGIEVVARAARDAGADALTVSNSFPALGVDVAGRRSVLGAGGGGLSGPAVRPLALRLVRDVAAAVEVPVIGCGGVCTATDAAAFLIAGASAVQVGTATFTRPDTMTSIVDGLAALCRELGVARASDLVGTLDQERS
jgi:dihydroorotate dehydrogenase (NAD+) catalytic subunit